MIRNLTCMLLACAGTACTQPSDPIGYVDPFIGTGFHGHTYPGAATPFGMVFLSRILGKALKESGRNPVAHFLAGELLDFFAGILQCFRDGDEMEHAEPLPQFSDLLREEYLWSEEYDEEADEMRYEEDEVFPADEFYSFYYDSWQSVEAYRDILEQVPAEFAKPAAAVLELL